MRLSNMGKLDKFNRIPFMVINRLANFHRSINTIIEIDHLKRFYANIDNVIIIYGQSEEEYNNNNSLN